MRIAVFCFFHMACIVISASALAQDVEVRSGAHDGYSRLVIEFPVAPDWRLEKTVDGYLLRTDASAARFDTDAVFRRIPGTRLSELVRQAGTGNLALLLACECEVSAFELERGAVVIDILDPVDDAAAPKPAGRSGASGTRPQPRPRQLRETFRLSEVFDGPVQLLQGSLGAEVAEIRLSKPDKAPDPAAGTALSVPFPDNAPQMVPSAELLVRSLARKIARAATQGLLETRRSRLPDPDGMVELAPGSANIRIETAHDRVFGTPQDMNEVSPSGNPCLPAREFDVGSWGDGRTPADQLSEARQRLVGELDDLDEDAVSDLVRLYIHLSFGLEAERVLESLGSDLPNADSMIELARLMEGNLGPGGILAEQISCGGAATLWAALALPALPSNQVIDADAILLAFSDLPPHLRRHLGPRLASRFAEANEVASVEAISNAVGRIAPPSDPAFALTQGQVAIADTGRSTGADATLEEIASGRHPDAPDALLLLIDSYAERSAVVPRAIIDTADIMTFELAGTELGGALKAATIRARLTRGEYREAFLGLAAAREDPPADAADAIEELESDALMSLVQNADDPDFLRRMLDPAGLDMALRARMPLRFELARRLLDIGFHFEANRLVSPNPEATGPEELDYAAQLSLALGAPVRAVGFARRSNTLDSVRLEADGLARAGRFAEAADLFLQMGDRSKSLQMSWRGGDWERLSEEADGPERFAAIALLEVNTALPFPSPPSLAAAEERLGASVELRELLEAVLEANPWPDP